MNVAGNDRGERTHASPAIGVAGQERRLGICLVEVFDDRQRLDQHLVADFERRHQALRVDATKVGSGLVAPAQVDEGVLVIELLEIEGDAHAKRGGGSKITVEFHDRRPSQTAFRRDVTPRSSLREVRAPYYSPPAGPMNFSTRSRKSRSRIGFAR